MTGRLRNMALYLGLVDDDEEEEFDYEELPARYDEPVQPAVNLRGSPGRVARGGTPSAHYDPRSDPREAQRSAMAPSKSPREPYRITTVQPRTYNEARTIGEHFREGVPVIINLTEMEDSDAKRLVDFAAGLIFGLRGSLERVTNKVFLLSPSNIEVSAEDKARIAEGGFFNQS